MSETVFRPGIALGSYPERRDAQSGAVEAALLNLRGRFRRQSPHGPSAGLRFVAAVEALRDEFESLQDDAFRARCDAIAGELRLHGYAGAITVEAFAAVREAAGRIMGKRHFHTQLLGGWALLRGYIAEMQTGEGKTLTTLLPACTAAMAGVPVHVVTANDYLAARDAETLAPVYSWFGLSIGVLGDEVREPAQRKAAYDCNLTYCSPHQVAFDYLRDRMTMGHRRDQLDHKIRAFTGGGTQEAPLFMRGLCFAIVDEADSVLIDDACTPLILSQQLGSPPPPDDYLWALGIAAEFAVGHDLDVETKYREVVVRKTSQARLDQCLATRAGRRSDSDARMLISQAFQALHCYVRDRDYLVRDGHIEIIDGNTGRAQADHAWERGLHQMIEAKEGCALTAPRKTIARMSYQRFFKRYLHLGGMSGTVSEVAQELWTVYRLQVMRVPTYRPSRRRATGQHIHTSSAGKWQAIARRTAVLQKQGRPVLIGTQSVAESEALGAVLAEFGIAHQLLNARQDAQEAAIVADAGRPGAVTVATNMAGRGTDIELAAEVRAAGGLHVIVASRNDSSRADRQLVGRCARQGDPGSWEAIVSLDDDLLKKELSAPLLSVSRSLHACGLQKAAHWAVNLAQRSAERQAAGQRRGVLRFDEQMKERMAFSGPLE